MRRLFWTTVAAACGVFAFAGAAMAAPLTGEWAEWNRPMKPVRIVGGVYDVGVAGLDIYLIKTSAGLILIDAGFEQTAPLIEDTLRQMGFKLKDVRYLINEHAHNDHAGGLAQLKRDTGAQVVAGFRDVPALRAGMVDYGPSAAWRFPPVKVDRAVRDGDTITLGGVTLTAHSTPGHTKGCTSWTLPLVEAGFRHTVIFNCSITVAGNPVGGSKTYPGITADYRSTFAKLRTIKADVYLAPHPNLFHRDDKIARIGKGPNPFVDPTELRRAVDQAEHDFEVALAKQKGSGK